MPTVSQPRRERVEQLLTLKVASMLPKDSPTVLISSVDCDRRHQQSGANPCDTRCIARPTHRRMANNIGRPMGVVTEVLGLECGIDILDWFHDTRRRRDNAGDKG